MDLGNPGRVGSIITGSLERPEGQELVKKFPTYAGGIAILQNFADTSDGQKTVRTVVLRITEALIFLRSNRYGKGALGPSLYRITFFIP